MLTLLVASTLRTEVRHASSPLFPPCGTDSEWKKRVSEEVRPWSRPSTCNAPNTCPRPALREQRGTGRPPHGHGWDCTVTPSRPPLPRGVGSFQRAPSFDIRSSTFDILQFRRGTGAPAPVPLPPEQSVGPGKIPRHPEDPRGSGGGPPGPREGRIPYPASRITHPVSRIPYPASRIAHPAFPNETAAQRPGLASPPPVPYPVADRSAGRRTRSVPSRRGESGAGAYATDAGEPRQDRKVAAVSRPVRAP